MTILDFERIVRTEQTATNHLLERCSAAAPPRCPVCSREKLYVIENGNRRRCARCGHTFNPFAGRWLDAVKIDARRWLWLVKLFELETPATVAADETTVSYPTVLKAVDTIRHAIAGTAGPAPPGCGADPAHRWFSGVAPGGDAPDRIGAVPGERIVLSMRIGEDCLVMTDRTLDCAALACCGRKLDVVDRGKSFPKLRVYSGAKGFWPFAKERLTKYHGVSPGKLPWYIEEMSFRWRNRGTPLFEPILDRLCAYAAPARPPSGRGCPSFDADGSGDEFAARREVRMP